MALEGLLASLKAMIPAEIIDGADVEKTASMVMLEVEHTPVLQYPVGDEASLMLDPPKPVEVQKNGEQWMIVKPESHDFDFVEEEALKVMRCRYLLVRGFYYQRLRGMGHQLQTKVRAWYFGDGVWLPREGSELSKLMDME